ncbi:hypothetical protein jhhlp_006598 [Lomentospora prolificans]|uniref:Low temperature viability protein n=1 Tax=Lomentospora prolificans TaxID=41688 RepID=A0A2N3N6D4_9PEZI|nr:hypothetical protein jhhlp_006598 [Lomentospora prolificans]
MPKGKWIDKKTATHFTLVHRPQNDPLIHDESAPQMVLNPTQKKGSRSKALDDLASELGSEVESIRDNEGEAANYGVYFDDTEYDYMQHLRDLNSGGPGEVVFVEANSSGNNGKGKNKMSLEDALRQMDLEHKADDLLDQEVLPSKNLQHVSYQAQQDVPDAIAGLQPDMDPRLREVLEALEDDEFVDNEDDDIFQALAKDGREIDEYEFEEAEFDDDDEGWESDHTAKPTKEYKDGDEAAEEADQVPELVSVGENGAQGDTWMEDFKKFKQDQKAGRPTGNNGSVLESTWTTTTNGGRRKKRKGALTNASSYSMTSSSLVRTEQLTLLDARFDKVEQRYQNDIDDDLGSVSAISTASSVTGPMRSDFDSVMDEFLTGYSKGRRPSKKNKGGQSGLDQLDEIRKGLGPARIPARR